jgi:hypothetical protein
MIYEVVFGGLQYEYSFANKQELICRLSLIPSYSKLDTFRATCSLRS